MVRQLILATVPYLTIIMGFSWICLLMVPFRGENVFPINLGVSLVSSNGRWSGLSMIIQIKYAFSYTIFGNDNPLANAGDG